MTNVQDVRLMFANATSFNGNLGGWTFSPLITELDRMFDGALRFNNPSIEQWNVDNILDMQHLFAGAITMNLDFSQWNTARVRDMSNMFRSAYDFTGIGLDSWDVSSVTNFESMFRYVLHLRWIIFACDVR